MQLAKLNGTKVFIRKHFEKLIFLNCLVAALVLYLHDILYSLDGGGRYVSAKDLLEVGLHGYNDHYFFGGIQNLFYPPLHDFLLSILIKLGEWGFGSHLNHRLLYSAFVFIIFNLFIYSLYKVSRQFSSAKAKIFLLAFSSWMLYLNVYSHEKNWGSFLNFYQNPQIGYFQGLSFQDIYITGITNQFLSAAFLILSILSLTKKNNLKSSSLISLTILSHFVFGLVAVLFCTVQKLFNREFKNLLAIGSICFGLTAFFVIPLLIYRDYLIPQVAVPFRTGFWLSTVAVAFLFFKNRRFSFLLAFTSLILVGLVGYAKVFQKFEIPIVNFHYYRFLFPSLVMLILAVAFALDEQIGKVRGYLLLGIFAFIWFGNFGGHFYPENILTAYEPKMEKIEPSQQNDFSEGRSYFFGIGRPVDFAVEVNTHLQNQRSFFTKGLYWESAPANRLISNSIFKMMGPPTVLEGTGAKSFENKTCDFYKCFFNSFLNMTGATEVWMPSKIALAQYFLLGLPDRIRFFNCYDKILESLKPAEGILKFSVIEQNRYINRNTALVKSVNANTLNITVDNMVARCELNSSDDGKINSDISPKISRSSSGNYEIELPPDPGSFHVSLQYFPGLMYDTDKAKDLIPKNDSSGIVITGANKVTLYYQRTWVMWISYFISLLTVIGMFTVLVVRSKDSSRSES
jgi:hypothetical protein